MNAQRLLAVWRSARASFWFVPLLMTIAGMALSFVTLWIDHRDAAPLRSWYFNGGHDGARTLLSVLAGSMITVASLVFSITIVPLTLASQQYGPRLLRNFIRDTGNQVVLGTFLATFMFCLLTLRSVRGGDGVETPFVPELSVTVAIGLAVASIGVLIWFIDHVAHSLRVSTLMARVGEVFDAGVVTGFPDQPPERPRATAPVAVQYGAVTAQRSGYVEAIDYAALVGIAARCDSLIEVALRPGRWAIEGNSLARVSAGHELTEETRGHIRAAFVLSTYRTHEQDVEFPAEQLTEIAVRALSPGLNDPFTAISCIDRLAAGLAAAVERHEPASTLCDHHGVPRLMRKITTHEGLINAIFDPLRAYAAPHASVSIRLLESIAAIGERVRFEGARQALLRQARLIESGAVAEISEQEDRNDVRERYWRALQALNARCSDVRAPNPERQQAGWAASNAERRPD